MPILGRYLSFGYTVNSFLSVNTDKNNLVEMKKYYTLLLFCLLIFALCMLPYAFLYAVLGGEHPSDQWLLDNFYEHEEEFETLVSMLQEDEGLYRVDNQRTEPEDPATIAVSPKRIRAYRILLSKLNISEGLRVSYARKYFEFIADTRGISLSGSAKGYLYLEEEPDLIVTDLEEYRSGDYDPYIAYRHIKGNWFLYLAVFP